MDISTYQVAVLSLSAMVFGIWALVKGGDLTVDGAVSLANRFNLSKVFIAATIIAFGTSVPELFTSMNANLKDYPGISMGNVVGSNIANFLFVFAVCCLFTPMFCNYDEVKSVLMMMLIATVILVGGVWAGIFGSVFGAFMFSILVIYVTYQYFFGDAEESDDDTDSDVSPVSLIGGLVLLAVGSELVVTGSVVVGGLLGVPEAIIGLTVVAIGTSLPELAASVTAARKGEITMIYGNLIGSNVFNVLSIVGLTAMVKPIIVDPAVNGAVLLACLIAIVFSYLVYRGYVFTRFAGSVMALVYGLYCVLLFA